MPKLDLPWFAFYPADWIKDGRLQTASLSTQGIWINALALMFLADSPGELSGTNEDFCRLFRSSSLEWELFKAEASRLKFCDMTQNEDAGHLIVTLKNRRMQRDVKATENRREQWRNRQHKHRAAADVTPPVTPTSRETRPLQSESQSETDHGSNIRRSSLSLVSDPDPKPKRSIKRPWPADLVLTAEMRAYALAHDCRNPELEFEHWRADCLSNGRQYVDWLQTWRNRILNAPKFAGRGSSMAPEPTSRPKPPDSREVAARALNQS